MNDAELDDMERWATAEAQATADAIQRRMDEVPPITVVRVDLIGVQGRVIRALLSPNVVDGELDPDVWENLCASLPDVDPTVLREVIRVSTYVEYGRAVPGVYGPDQLR